MTAVLTLDNGYQVALADTGELDTGGTSVALLATQGSVTQMESAIAQLAAKAHRLELLLETQSAAAREVITARDEAEALAASRLHDRDEAESLANQRLAHIGQLQSQITAHEQWKDQLVIDLHYQGSDRGLCSEFDDWMEEHDLPARSNDYSVEVRLIYTTTLSVTARDHDAARREAESILGNSRSFPSEITVGHYSLSEHSNEIVDVERD